MDQDLKNQPKLFCVGMDETSCPFPHENKQDHTRTKKKKRVWRDMLRHIRCQTCSSRFFPTFQEDGVIADNKRNRDFRSRIKTLIGFKQKKIRNIILRLLYNIYRIQSLFINCFFQFRRFRRSSPVVKSENFAVVSAFFNPSESTRRVENFLQFFEEVKQSGVNYLMVELAFGDEPFILSHDERVIQLRTKSVLWHKERLLNIGIQRLLEEGYEKIAWLDGDISFLDPQWSQRISEKLDEVKLCQVFETIRVVRRPELAPQIALASVSYFRKYGTVLFQNLRVLPELLRGRSLGGQSGFGWAARAEVLREVSLYEHAIVGGADKMILAASLLPLEQFGELEKLTQSYYACPTCGHRNSSAAYTKHYINWAKRWSKAVGGSVGYVLQEIQELYHGPRVNRKYMERRELLFDNNYDPLRDVQDAENASLEWSVPKSKFSNQVWKYFWFRGDDA